MNQDRIIHYNYGIKIDKTLLKELTLEDIEKYFTKYGWNRVHKDSQTMAIYEWWNGTSKKQVCFPLHKDYVDYDRRILEALTDTGHYLQGGNDPELALEIILSELGKADFFSSTVFPVEIKTQGEIANLLDLLKFDYKRKPVKRVDIEIRVIYDGVDKNP